MPFTDDPEVIAPMKALSPRRTSRTGRRLVTGVAATLLTLGLATTPAVAGGDDKGSQTTNPPLSISPSAGGAGTSVTVRSTCQPGGPATSEAFQADINLSTRESDGRWVGTGKIRTSGLTIGKSYPVTLVCADGVTLTTNFTFTSATPSGGAGAGFGGTAGEGGGAQATALAVGGGLAVAGAVGYVFLARRRRSAGNHSY
ncbi:hypothetical protein N0X72_15750 [Streptomyces carpaticus]|nr:MULTISPECIES: hypothetical protein [Streptomyces]QKV69951.1 hypothetical protein HUT13_15065 [Streptomyces harbinensis]UWM50346.1 hypothetical protein N0X72_15750 [Streptomyces carpaticus]